MKDMIYIFVDVYIHSLIEKYFFMVNPTWHKIFFSGLDMGGARGAPPPGKHPSGTFMSSNDLVTHQAHKNGQF